MKSTSSKILFVVLLVLITLFGGSLPEAFNGNYTKSVILLMISIIVGVLYFKEVSK